MVGRGEGRAQLLLALGPMTMAHGLARLVMAEQLYRACTILTGHPYHGGIETEGSGSVGCDGLAMCLLCAEP